MMTMFLTYNLKVAVIMAVLYMFFRLLLSHETFHRFNRVVLLIIAALSFVLPLCVITFHQTLRLPMSEMYASASDRVMPAEAETPLWMTIAAVVYVAGMAVTLCHTLLSIFRVNRLIRLSELHPQVDGTTIAVTEDNGVAPFSWMHFIVMNRSDFMENDAAIIAHEKGHIDSHHSADVLFISMVTVLQWFNPAMWMLGADLRSIHEYEADCAVLSQGINARQYQYLLIRKAVGDGGYSITNSFNHSTLKNRITMMLRKKSSTNKLYKCLFILPVVAVSVALNARTVTQILPADNNNKVQVAEKKITTNVKENPSATESSMISADRTVAPQTVKNVGPKGKTQKARIEIAQRNGKQVYLMDGKEVSKSEIDKLAPGDIQSIKVNSHEGEDGEQMKADMSKVNVIIDGKTVSMDELNKINPADIESMEVNKKNNANGDIIVHMKKK